MSLMERRPITRSGRPGPPPCPEGSGKAGCTPDAPVRCRRRVHSTPEAAGSGCAGVARCDTVLAAGARVRSGIKILTEASLPHVKRLTQARRLLKRHRLQPLWARRGRCLGCQREGRPTCLEPSWVCTRSGAHATLWRGRFPLHGLKDSWGNTLGTLRDVGSRTGVRRSVVGALVQILDNRPLIDAQREEST